MNRDRIEGKWKQIHGTLQEHWGRMTNNYVSLIDGKRTKRLGEMQESYGIARDRARHQVRTWKKANNQLQVISSDSRRWQIGRCAEGQRMRRQP